MQDLIVLVPGIMGSVLHRDGKLAWGFSAGGAGTALLSGAGSLRDTLTLQGDDPALDDLGDGVSADALMPDLHLLPGFWKIDGYSAVARALAENFRLVPGQNLFEFPYDWRRHNAASARRLGVKVREWLRAWRANGYGQARVVFVAHSMGGLVVRHYLEVLGGWEDGSTRALITIGTPFRGSLNALRTLVNGIRLGPFELEPISQLCRSFSSTYELLPIFPAYDAGDGRLRRVGSTTGIPHVDSARAGRALEFHHTLRDAVERNRADPRWAANGYETFPVVGRGQLTDYVARRDGDSLVMSRMYNGEELGGDGTVPRVSAIPLEFDDTSQRGDLYATTTHGSLQNADSVIAHVVGRINDLYTNFGAFRGLRIAEEPPAVALEVGDLVRSDEPILVRARPGRAQRLTVQLFRSRTAAPVQTVIIEPSIDEWLECRFEPVPAGDYRVVISGSRADPVEEAVAVADARVAAAVASTS